MQSLGFLLQIGLESYVVGFSLGLAEDDGSSMTTTVEVDNVCDDGHPVGIWATHAKVLYSFGGLHSGFLDQVNVLSVLGEIFPREIYHPGRNCG